MSIEETMANLGSSDKSAKNPVELATNTVELATQGFLQAAQQLQRSMGFPTISPSQAQAIVSNGSGVSLPQIAAASPLEQMQESVLAGQIKTLVTGDTSYLQTGQDFAVVDAKTPGGIEELKAAGGELLDFLQDIGKVGRDLLDKGLEYGEAATTQIPLLATANELDREQGANLGILG